MKRGQHTVLQQLWIQCPLLQLCSVITPQHCVSPSFLTLLQETHTTQNINYTYLAKTNRIIYLSALLTE